MNLSVLFYSLGYVTGVAAFAWIAKRRGMLTQGVFAVMAAGLVGALIAANLAQIVTGNPGKTVLGGAAGGYLAVMLYKRRLGITRPTGDLFAVAWCAGEAVGRWGCYFGGCCFGTACRLPWAVWQHGAYRHPSQIYLSLACAAILVILVAYDRLKPPENSLFFLQGLLYCATRFVVEFFRDGLSTAVGLSLGQLACVAGFAFFLYKFSRLIRASSSEAASEPLQVAEQMGAQLAEGG